MALILISSGRGPLECELAVSLYRALFLARYPGAVVRKEQPGKAIAVAGKRLTPFKSVLVDVPEAHAVQTGVVKWICQSPVRPQHRRKNWFIEVARVSDEDLPPEIETTDVDPVELDKRLFLVETFRSPGKGGQKVNKVETGVRIKHVPTGLTAQSVTARTQLANKKLALQRLQEMIQQHNSQREGKLAEAEWHNHDQLERGNAFAVYSGLEFTPIS